jgi:hypothetical protein
MKILVTMNIREEAEFDQREIHYFDRTYLSLFFQGSPRSITSKEENCNVS